MRIGNRDVPYDDKHVAVSDLVLDPKNPRLQALISLRGGSATDKQLEEMLWERNQVKALKTAIKENGGVREAIIVRQRGSEYIVAEGNQRTVASRKLCEESPQDGYCSIPAMVFDEAQLTEADLATVLAEIHVAGKDKWDAYEKARHIHELFSLHGKTYEWLTNNLRMSKSAVTQTLGAYKAMAEYLALHPKDRITKFSFFSELFKKKDLKERYETDPKFKDDFRSWVANDKFTDPRHVRSLELVLENPKARHALDTKGMVEAEKVLREQDPSLEAGIYSLMKKTAEGLRSFPLSETQELKQGNVAKALILRELYRAIQDVALAGGVQL